MPVYVSAGVVLALVSMHCYVHGNQGHVVERAASARCAAIQKLNSMTEGM